MAGDAQRTWSSWLRGVASCGLLALCVALPVWGLGRVVSVLAPVLVAVAMAAAVAVLTADRAAPVEDGRGRPTGPPPTRRARLRWWALVVAGCASAVLCAAVAAAVAPGLVLVWLAALGLTTPPVRAHLLARLRPAPPAAAPRDRAAGTSRPDPTATGPGPAVGAPRPGATYDPRCTYRRVSDLGTTELCHLWRVTYWAVRDTRSPVRTVHVVQLRHAVLDELEKRHPDAVAQWLGSGHHGADGPARYL